MGSEMCIRDRDKFNNFHSVRQHFPNHLDLVCQKGIFPYEWLDSFEKLQYKGLPPLKDFYSSLRKENCTEQDHRHGLRAYDALTCKIFQDYMLVYLKTDVLLLADVFMSFRQTCITYYKLDPANYLSAPSLA